MKPYKSKSKKQIFDYLYKIAATVFKNIQEVFGEFIQLLNDAVNSIKSRPTQYKLGNQYLPYGDSLNFNRLVEQLYMLLPQILSICNSYNDLSKQNITQN